LPAKSQSLRFLSAEAETICLPSGLKFALKNSAGNCLQTFVGHTAVVSSANFSPDGKQIVSVSWDKSLKLWDLAGNCLQTFVGHTDMVSSANFSPDGKQIVSVSWDNKV
jgi:WD40 repeat protein